MNVRYYIAITSIPSLIHYGISYYCSRSVSETAKKGDDVAKNALSHQREIPRALEDNPSDEIPSLTSPKGINLNPTDGTKTEQTFPHFVQKITNSIDEEAKKKEDLPKPSEYRAPIPTQNSTSYSTKDYLLDLAIYSMLIGEGSTILFRTLYPHTDRNSLDKVGLVFITVITLIAGTTLHSSGHLKQKRF